MLPGLPPSVTWSAYGHKPRRARAVPTKNFVLVEPVEFQRRRLQVTDPMFTIIFSLFSSIRLAFRTRAALQTEILALRHQLLVIDDSYCTR